MSNILTEHGITLWDEEKIKRFRTTLLNWYDTHKRDLPWRRTNNPYAIWVSEIMLQQTQVITVIPYYKKFMATFPSIQDLANAPEDVLLKTWEGLGYYSRVRNMQSAAQQIVAHYNGQMPNTIEHIRTLKGIGPYTAGAIASIAFNLPEPAIDGNVMRVMARLFEINLDIANPKNRKVFDYLMRQLIDPTRPGDFNQALMDLGSDICSAKNPKPELSPIKEFNAAYQNGTMSIYPIKEKKKKATDVFYTAYVIQDKNGAFLMQQRNNKGLLANMWQFPMIERKPVNSLSEESTPYHILHQQEALGSITHLFSHLKWHVYLVPIQDSTFEGTWIHPKDFHKYPMGAPQLKLFDLLKQTNFKKN
ncbi:MULTISPECIES: A/G-specific adenine glycosylase [unclassified Granulicatella]|uniref:A/G-specific adenine glycosylase n=1 Tax=unclassified Granulicatella TaxID=2630493 RepID=UPI001073BBE6|nr:MULTISPECIES: A/G-specific adenine glycosylase [unclassified Granulicatella]MBF0780783.1 A/G-specific adenine glycosylase [Granulicatella sp. 19428wC4_WM01]TFU93828.1 A/G-specific adenine glycosylase [Granulicatella sp. WM01]